MTRAKGSITMPRQSRLPNIVSHSKSMKGYRFREKDPDLDFVCAEIVDSGLTLIELEKRTAEAGHKVSRYTMLGWLYGKTMRPQHYTFCSVMSALGYENKWIKGGK